MTTIRLTKVILLRYR